MLYTLTCKFQTAVGSLSVMPCTTLPAKKNYNKVQYVKN